MFSLPLIIIVVTALAATGIAALGLQLFFRLLEPSQQTRAVPTRRRD